MCSEYSIKTDEKAYYKAIDDIINKTGETKWDRRVKFGSKEVPIVSKEKENLVLVNSQWPTPPPLPNARLSGSDYDAENIRRIYTLPTWKRGFSEAPILVPMTKFFEPAYWGEEAGSIQGFSIPEEELFFCAGLKFAAKGKDELDRFALITHTPTRQMLEYHKRLVVLLKPEHAVGYLEAENSEDRFNYLLKYRYQGELKVEKERMMAKGWEKRTQERMKDLEAEKIYMKKLKIEGVEG